MRRLALVAAMLALSGSGCVTRVGDLSVVSTRMLSVPVEKAPKRVSGGSCAHWVWALATIGFGEQNLKAAIDEALSQPGATQYDALVDVVETKRKLWFLFYGQECLVVEGTPARIGVAAHEARVAK